MRLNKPRFQLRSLGGLPGDACYDVQPSQGAHLRLGYLTRLTHMMKPKPMALEASAHSEMRRAQTEAERARESALARAQLTRQLAR